MRDKLTEILGIDPRCEKPNAYELFGLATGESDVDRIQAAIGATVQRLKQRQDSTDVATWKRAALAVSKAKKLLVEPAAKSAYDAKLRSHSGTGSHLSSNAAAVATQPGKGQPRKVQPRKGQPRKGQPRKVQPRGEAALDPLRGLLPAIDPLAPFDMDAAARRAANSPRREPPRLPPDVDLPPNIQAPPPVEVDASSFDDEVLEFDEAEAETEPEDGLDALAVPSPPKVSRAPVRRRRRGMPVTMIVIGLLTVTMLSGVGWGIYQLVEREKTRNSPAVAQADVAQSGSNGAQPNAGNAAAEVGPRVVDPVMGGGSSPRRVADTQTDDRATRQPPMNRGGNASPVTNMGGMDGNDAADGPPMTEPPGREQESMMEVTPVVAPEPTRPEPMQPTDAEMQVADKALQSAEAAIRNRDWKQMKPLAEMAQEVAATDQQKTMAQQLFEVADLADYYRQGIIKALGDLKSGNTFMLTEGVEVAVVEASATELVLQVNGRSKSFPVEEMPFVLVHKLGTFTMTKEDPVVMAAKAVYQAISLKALPQDRQQAAQWLKELPAEIEGSHPHEIAVTLERLFPAS